MLETLRRALSGAANAISSLKATEAGLRAERQRLLEEEQGLLQAPAPKAEIIAQLRELVAHLGAAWTGAHSRDTIAALGGRVERGIGPPDSRPPDSIVGPSLPDALRAALTFDALCALAPDVAVAGLTRLVEGAEYQAGPPMSTRLARLAQIADAVAELETRHTELCETASVEGITIPLLDEVRARRTRAEFLRERQEREAQDRARRIRA